MHEHDQVKGTKMEYGKERAKAENPVKIEDLTLRDGHQSLFATRGRTEDMIPVAEMMDEVGFWAVETWGGATFDTMHRFLNEDPWERIRTLKRYIKKTPFSMLLRAQNLVGYRNYADDVARAFVDRACANGMDIFRTFDALNDYRNFETVVPVIKQNGKHFQGCICYTMTEPRLGGEVYNLEYYVNKGKALEAMGADTVCVKDMAGLIAPYDAYEVIKALKAAVTVPVHLHSHFTSGMSPMSHLKAIEAGVDIIDTCMTPYAYRTSHAAIEPLVMALLGTNRDTGFDIRLLSKIDVVLEPGTYYVKMTLSPLAFFTGETWDYSITVTLAEPPLAELEPNDSCGEANAVNLGDSLQASISPIGDRDHFLLTVPADGFVEIATDGPVGDTVLNIASMDGSVQIGCDDDGGNGLFSMWGCCLPAGDYCVAVKDFGDNSSIATYTIDFRELGVCTPGDPLQCSISLSSQCNPF